jgi:hypothetical protein
MAFEVAEVVVEDAADDSASGHTWSWMLSALWERVWMTWSPGKVLGGGLLIKVEAE